MKNNRLIVLIVFGCMFYNVSFSQTDTISSFNTYYEKSIEKLRSLYATRGVNFLCDKTGNPFQEVSKISDNYGKFYSSRLGILFYSFNNDTLRTWLLKDKKLFYQLQPLSKNKLVEAEVDLRKALKVDLLLNSRNAKNRGVIIKGKDTVKRKTLDETITNATNILLPKNIAKNLIGLKHIIIIPEYNISQFPLYILKPFGNDAYLIDSLSVSIAPHLCNFSDLINKYDDLMGKGFVLQAKNPKIIGNPLFTKNSNYNLSPLPEAENEAKEIASLLNSTALIGKQATLNNVLSHSNNTNLFYFATHGYADLEKGLAGSFLAFTPDSTNPDGLWNAKSIQQQKFSAPSSIAILSACQTGVGKIYDAGFIGIGRAFFKAGIDHTIMSLWSVDDLETKKFMTSFIKILTTEEKVFYPAAHLRKAILEYKKTNPNPAHWAPFMVFGFPY